MRRLWGLWRKTLTKFRRFWSSEYREVRKQRFLTLLRVEAELFAKSSWEQFLRLPRKESSRLFFRRLVAPACARVDAAALHVSVPVALRLAKTSENVLGLLCVLRTHQTDGVVALSGLNGLLGSSGGDARRELLRGRYCRRLFGEVAKALSL